MRKAAFRVVGYARLKPACSAAEGSESFNNSRYEPHREKTCLSGVCDQERLEQACSALEAVQRLGFVCTSTLAISLI